MANPVDEVIEKITDAMKSGSDDIQSLANSKDEDGRLPVHWAASRGYADKVKFLVSRGGPVNPIDEDGWTPLHCAAAAGSLRCVEHLLDHGGNVSLKTESNQCQPLHYAASKGHLEVVKCLAAAKADINNRDRTGLTPLARAVSTGKLTVVKFLIELGAEMTEDKVAKDTPLHIAVNNQHLEIAEALLTARAELATIPNAAGRTPFDEAPRELLAVLQPYAMPQDK
eukprot:Selendium_serpulae@DN6176_c0_g2_i4.p1